MPQGWTAGPAPQAETPAGLLAAGNIDLAAQPRVKNPDGSVSTVRSIGVNIDGKEVLIPTVVGNRVVSNDEAIAEYKRSGKHLGIFSTPAASDAFAKKLHEDYAAGKYDAPASKGWAPGSAPKPDDAVTSPNEQLLNMILSPDAETRAAGQRLAATMLPEEKKAFFDFQQEKFKGTDRTANRQDSNILSAGSFGVAPEDLLIAGQMVKHIGGTMLAETGGAVAKILAGLRASVATAMPVVKYEAVKTGLEAAGLPSAISVPLAMAASGRSWRRGGAAGAAAETVAAEAVPAAQPPVAPPSTAPRKPGMPAGMETPLELTRRLKAENLARQASQAPPVAPPVAAAPPPSAVPPPVEPVQSVPPPAAAATPPPAAAAPAPAQPAAAPFYPQKALNEIALAARRGKVGQLSGQEYQQGLDLVRGGKTPQEALEAVVAERQPPLLHGSPNQLKELQPGSMMTSDPTWAAGYTTKQNATGGESFVGSIHSAAVPEGPTVTAPTLHQAEGKLIEMARGFLGREPTTLREAAETVAARTDLAAIVVKKNGKITDAITLRSTPVSSTTDPVAVLRDAQASGKRIPSNLEAALETNPSEKLAALPGMMTDAQVAEREAARQASGKIKASKFAKAGGAKK